MTKLAKTTNVLVATVNNALDNYIHDLKEKKLGLKLYKGQNLTPIFEQIQHLLTVTKSEKTLDDIIVDIVLHRINFLRSRGIGEHEISAHILYCADLGYEISFEEE